MIFSVNARNVNWPESYEVRKPVHFIVYLPDESTNTIDIDRIIKGYKFNTIFHKFVIAITVPIASLKENFLLKEILGSDSKGRRIKGACIVVASSLHRHRIGEFFITVAWFLSSRIAISSARFRALYFRLIETNTPSLHPYLFTATASK